MRLLLAAVLALSLPLFAPAGAVRADELPEGSSESLAIPESEPETATPAAEPAAPTSALAGIGILDAAAAPSDGHAAIDDWNQRRGWRYGTEMLFPFSRGMDDAGIPRPAQWPLYLATVPLDAALLPLGLLAGLFGG